MFVHCYMPGTVPDVLATVPQSQVCVWQWGRCIGGARLWERDELQQLEMVAECEEGKEGTGLGLDQMDVANGDVVWESLGDSGVFHASSWLSTFMTYFC